MTYNLRWRSRAPDSGLYNLRGQDHHRLRRECATALQGLEWHIEHREEVELMAEHLGRAIKTRCDRVLRRHRPMDGPLAETEKEKVIRSMDLIESKTCIKFRKRQCDEEVYILINKMAGRGCFALIGHRPQYSPMLVNLQAPECLLYSGTIQHELLHVIGLFHEQARADRDEYVEIVWDNVEEDHYFDFSKAPPGYTTTYNVPYNLYSIMHYPNIAFSKNGQPTIISKKDPKNTDMGQREGVTEGDLEKVRRMYHCKNTNPSNESNNNNQISNIFNIFNIFKVN
ncbi:hatching enzyme 1.2-like [Lycorma delicatula]|uniref:hatching enzyme 1.2-like n=1 Tax=Lycorma delicatula TaxID=130591 RepID=UPI003F50E2CF